MKPASGRRPVPSRPQSIDRLKQAQNDYKNILLNAGDIVMDDNFKVNGLAGSPAGKASVAYVNFHYVVFCSFQVPRYTFSLLSVTHYEESPFTCQKPFADGPL